MEVEDDRLGRVRRTHDGPDGARFDAQVVVHGSSPFPLPARVLDPEALVQLAVDRWAFSKQNTDILDSGNSISADGMSIQTDSVHTVRAASLAAPHRT